MRRRGHRCHPMEPASARQAHPRLGRHHQPIRDRRFGKTLYRDSDAQIVEAVARVAERRGVSRAQVALAWVARNPVVTSPIVGATKPHQLDDALAAIELELTDDEVAELEAPYEGTR